MENLFQATEAIEKDMLHLSNQVKPTWVGRWLDPSTAERISRLLKIGALSLRIIRLNYEAKELLHLRATLEEEYHERGD